jgi:hypothetical protein
MTTTAHEDQYAPEPVSGDSKPEPKAKPEPDTKADSDGGGA